MENDITNKVHKDAKTREEHFFNHGMRGELSDIGGPVRYNDEAIDSQSHEQPKKKHDYSEMLHVILEAL